MNITSKAVQLYYIRHGETAAQIEADLSEWDYGDYEGRRSVDICRARPDWNVFHDGCPGGETPASRCGMPHPETSKLCRARSALLCAVEQTTGGQSN
jgi:broad specificity phosphatase PhoE